MTGRRTNGKAKKARQRVLDHARLKGEITHLEAKRIGRWQHAYYHLMVLCAAGLLKRAEYNIWKPTRSLKDAP